MLDSLKMADAANLGVMARALSRLRFVMLALAVLCLLLAASWQWQLPWLLLAQALVTLGLCNVLLPRSPWRADQQLFAGLLADIVVLTELLAFSGGAANPLASLYLPPVLFAALLLPARQTWCLALASMLAYALLFVWHLPWPLAGDDAAYAFQLHLIGMWLTFAVSVLLLTLFVSRLSRQVRQQAEALQQARELQLRDEQLVAIGVQAAGAAHHLSTPLNTLTLLCEEMRFEQPDHPDLVLMAQQLQLCRSALASLKAGVEVEATAQPLFGQLAARLQGWHASRPGVALQRACPASGGPLMRLDPRFWPAFFNLLNNAAEAGDGVVELDVVLTPAKVEWQIRNRSGRLSEAQLARAGLAPLDSSKPAGMGIGMMLSHATLSHLGGELQLINEAQGGVLAIIRMPREDGDGHDTAD